jgi:hypothetical protein
MFMLPYMFVENVHANCSYSLDMERRDMDMKHGLAGRRDMDTKHGLLIYPTLSPLVPTFCFYLLFYFHTFPHFLFLLHIFFLSRCRVRLIFGGGGGY